MQIVGVGKYQTAVWSLLRSVHSVDWTGGFGDKFSLRYQANSNRPDSRLLRTAETSIDPGVLLVENDIHGKQSLHVVNVTW